MAQSRQQNQELLDKINSKDPIESIRLFQDYRILNEDRKEFNPNQPSCQAINKRNGQVCGMEM